MLCCSSTGPGRKTLPCSKHQWVNSGHGNESTLLNSIIFVMETLSSLVAACWREQPRERACFGLGKPALGGWYMTPLHSCRVSQASLAAVGWLVSPMESWICLEEKLSCHPTGRVLTAPAPCRLCWAGHIHRPGNDDHSVPVLCLSPWFSHRGWFPLCPLRKFTFA